ncbi:ubiquitin carboxyl-terminal hydrolase 45 [Lutzomyia longipalpis]|uniref:Ubiquitin carboxyl-terminal hydrolase n=1 Tax=Lutzomyia longipalpis TaxID=7200 RepID=A0A7G3B3C6_LUTLO|nr:ubiquitin carboxyl-terminal hydrolase 45 [Lutzomyia longipalpis]XP_055683895.1 ubiquitin carboxyl-terminal hydrolase 45 [Lutzomyia longipalpis]XP_055683896.1 ubiquitin carboxyl-terminal hydrolase 45 [Lutzomyia longipalpis]
MGKNKRQTDPVLEGDESSTESCDEKQIAGNQGGATPSCSHVAKSVDQNRLRKLLKASGLELEDCKECSKSSSTNANAENDFEYDKSLWMCLKCGSQLCGRSRNQHALKHFMTPRSDQHALVVNTTRFDVWCYLCDGEVNPSCPKKLFDCVDFLKKEAAKAQTQSSKSINVEEKIVATLDTIRPLVSETQENLTIYSSQPKVPPKGLCEKSQTLNVNDLPRIRGLTNLGNTCFFNAVLQCLAQTPYLVEILRESSKPGEQFQLPGGLLKLSDGTEVNLPPISGTLNAWGNLTSTLAETIDQLRMGGGVYAPRKLFNQLTAKWPQFSGGDQHDSHELLRHLLESVRSEDLRRYQSVILRSLGYSSKVDPQTVEGDMKQKIKFYGQQAGERILKPERVFRGFLVSTLMCQDCYHTSSRHEYFLDISLPVSLDKPQPPIRRKSSPEPENTPVPTKSRIKKDREKEAKAKRQKRKRIHSNQAAGAAEDSTDNLGINESNAEYSSNEQSDADIEDNCLDDVPKASQNATKTRSPIYDNNGNSTIKCSTNPEKVDDAPENPNKDITEDTANTTTDSATQQVNEETKSVLVEMGISEERAMCLVKQNSKTETQNFAVPVSQMEDLSLSEKTKLNDQKDDSETEVDKCNEIIKPKQTRIRTYSHADWSSTLAPRYQCEEGECSVQSCLNNFTALELMTGNNRVGCDACTERINGKGGKTINTNATKQFFISSPPAVLILHLKRFQIGPRFMSRKLCKPVTFPTLLDIAPFCGSKVKNLPNVDRHQKKLIYSLYGIVEHSGGMRAGHYIAYVKVRPQMSPDDRRWKFPPQGSKVELDQEDEERVRLEESLDKIKYVLDNDSDDSSSTSADTGIGEEEGAVGGSDEPNVEAPPGKWYYVSDSRVQEVSEDAALKSQAYLLFYERIY